MNRPSLDSLRGDWNSLDEQDNPLGITSNPRDSEEFESEELDISDMKNALVKEVELLEQVCLTLEGTRQTLDEDAKKLKQAQISHQEDRSRSIKPASSRAREPEPGMIELDQWPKILDDSEATSAFELLYKDLKSWVEEHYASLVYAGLPTDTQRLGLGKYDCTGFFLPHCQSGIDILHTIHGELFKYLFIFILSPFIVGTSNSSWDHHLRVVDKEIQKLCPVHVWRHWRCASSCATASLEKENLEFTCNDIVHRVETKFGNLACSESSESERGRKLKQLVWRCVDFKQKLERQSNNLKVWWSPLGTPLREERMISITGEYPTNGTVGRTLWPLLYREMAGEWVILAKETVIACAEPSKTDSTKSSRPESLTGSLSSTAQRESIANQEKDLK